MSKEIAPLYILAAHKGTVVSIKQPLPSCDFILTLANDKFVLLWNISLGNLINEISNDAAPTQLFVFDKLGFLLIPKWNNSFSLIDLSIFNLSTKTIIQCSKSEKLRDICTKFATKVQKDINTLYFIYNGNQLNMELTFNQQANQIDLERKEMSVLVNENTNTMLNESATKSKEIICPKCGEICLINFKNYKINLFECKNSHETNNILLNHYNNTQIIYENNIICDICNKYNKSITYNKQFFKCLTCNKNLCPICKSNHNSKHKIIDYDNKNYICEIHNDSFYTYCKDCKKNLCIKCKSKHNDKHTVINYENILPDDDEIKEKMEDFRKKIDKLNEDINKIIKILKEISENMETYYNINNNLLDTYELSKRNYHILENINFIKNNIIVNDIDEIINNNDITKKFISLINVYKKLINNTDENLSNNNQINYEKKTNKNNDERKIYTDNELKNEIKQR